MRQHTRHHQLKDRLKRTGQFRAAFPMRGKISLLVGCIIWIAYILFSAALFFGSIDLLKMLGIGLTSTIHLTIFAVASGFPLFVILWSESLFSDSLQINDSYFRLFFPDINNKSSSKRMAVEPVRMLLSVSGVVVVMNDWYRIIVMPRYWRCTDDKNEAALYVVSTTDSRLVLQLVSD